VRCDNQIVAGSKDRMYVSYGLGEQWYVPTCLPYEIDVVDLTWDGSIMYHVSYDGVLRHSREQGSNWQVLNSPFEGVNYTALRYHDNGLYLGTREHGLHFTDDMGETWQTVEALPNNATIRRITATDTIIAVGCEDGSIYLKYESSDEWQPMENIPVNGPILDICIDGNLIYASPMAGGIWYTELPAMSDDVTELSEVSLTIAPNPASVYIIVSASKALQDAELTVYDLHGNVCYSGTMQGNHQEKSTYGFPTGIYFVKVAGDKAFAVRKVAIQH
jgi:hypothetical protein